MQWFASCLALWQMFVDWHLLQRLALSSTTCLLVLLVLSIQYQLVQEEKKVHVHQYQVFYGAFMNTQHLHVPEQLVYKETAMSPSSSSSSSTRGTTPFVAAVSSPAISSRGHFVPAVSSQVQFVANHYVAGTLRRPPFCPGDTSSTDDEDDERRRV